MLLELAHEKLGWPRRDAVLNPAGAGPSVYARLVQAKVGGALSRRQDVSRVSVGVLTADPAADATEPPIAIVCEFPGVASEGAIEEAHRLAWNFCRAPLLVTLEPHLIRSWTTCERPRLRPTGKLPEAEIEPIRLDPGLNIDFEAEAARSLSWVSLVSGQLFRDYESRFPRKKCADETLLDNLKVVRDELHADGVPVAVAHDLLARLMFVQFLFHRKDAKGRAALTPEWLHRQHRDKVLSERHDGLESVLRNRQDTYAFFRLLNERFNGDLFPAKSPDPEEREAQWRAEMGKVTTKHLNLLADFVGGQMKIGTGQRSLWPMYAFDVIPLEFISSVYEAFVSKDKGTHYTPSHLVDIVLDTCLPWEDPDWDVKVLDPSCGSGIFLVKAFQRLVHRWRLAHGHRSKPDTDVLRELLTENLLGVDVQEEAVRVACFSLYLAMCDELEPRHVWNRVKFPPLRGTRLIAHDFFREDQKGFRSLQDREQFDVVVGNAPWGSGTLKESTHARKWVKSYKSWEASYENIGPLFLAKGVKLVKPGGRVSMLQPSGLLFNTVGTAATFRKRLVERHQVEQIINLSALRFGLFTDAVSPACIFCVRPEPPDGRPITYVSPKPSQSADDDFRIVFDAYDYHAVLPSEAERDPTIWTALMWGGRRDHQLVRRLSELPTLAKMDEKGQVRKRQGIVRGESPKHRNEKIIGLPILETTDFPAAGFPFLDPADLPQNTNPKSHRPIGPDTPAFQPSQLLIKSGWRRESGRFQARVVAPSTGPALCSELYVSVHFPDALKLSMDAACLVYNSKLAAYYLLHTSSRFASFIQEVNVDDLLRVPLPPAHVDLKGVASPQDTDDRVRRAFDLKAPEWFLVEDAFEYTLAAFKATKQPPKRVKAGGKVPAMKVVADAEMLQEYGAAFSQVIRAGFGQDKQLRMTVYRPPDELQSPVHLVAIHLGWPGNPDPIVHFEDIRTEALLSRIVELATVLEEHSPDGKTLRRRVARAYDNVKVGHAIGPTMYLCKPSVPRYWTRSMAMRDADEVAKDLILLAAANRPRRKAASA